jgi:excinuclease ABC subunit A
LGWCEQCEGLGTQLGASSANIVVHPTRSILDGAIAGWEQVPPGSKLHILLASLADFIGFHPDQPWNLLGEAHRLQVLHGCGEEWIGLRVPRSAPAALHRELSGVRFRWRGFYPAISRATRVSWQYRKRLEELVTEVPCDACLGGRLKPEPAAVRLGESTLHEVCTKPLGRTLEWFQGLRLDARQRRIAGELLHEVTSRLRFLVDVGLDYVTLHRVAGTLSGGEAQRIQLASQIGTGLTGVLYVLDEPTIGLHPRDNARLIAALGRLRALGNTLLVVEHDREVIGAADHVLDFGPGAGRYGGEITATGSPKRLRSNPASLTGKYLSGRASIPVPANRRPMATVERWLTIHGARENNLREIEVRFPLGRLTCITGVSGSGKSTLIAQILYPALASRLHGARLVPGGHDRLSGVEHVDKVINVDQSPIGNSPTSNAATYTGVFDEIRELFAKLPEAKVRGYGANRFSFNRPGGRCEACEGMGQRRIEMHFLPDVWVECENCGGTRYVPETLDVQFRGKSIADVLKLSVREACELFQSVPRVARMLRTLDDVGLGYLHLGQAAPTLSGGEAQRVKLAAELGRPSTGKTLYLLDEPTTGLHLDDLRKLLSVLHRLVDLDVIKTADWVIDLGPEAGEDGGTIVVEGTPEQAATVQESHTGRALGPVLAAGPIEDRPVHGPTSVTTGASAATAAAREGPGSAEPAPEFSAEVRMPWERDGRRWHTERTDRQGRPIRWDPKLLTWLVETIEVAGDFAPTNWNSQARIEIKAPGKCEWFAHLLTGGRDLLDVLIRFPHGLLTPTQVRQALDLKTLDERTDLPIYGQQERAVLRARSPEWDEIRCTPRDFADVNRTKWRALLRRCAAAYMEQARAQQQDPGRGEPWREDGRTWHLSQQSISKNHMVRWQPTLLVALLGLFDKLQRDLRVDWKGKVCIGLKVPGEAKPAGKIVTNMGAGLRLELRTPPTMFTPAQVERLGFNREIRRGTECDWVIFWARSLDHLDREQLLGVWRESRAFFDVAATGDTGRRQAS